MAVGRRRPEQAFEARALDVVHREVLSAVHGAGRVEADETWRVERGGGVGRRVEALPVKG